MKHPKLLKLGDMQVFFLQQRYLEETITIYAQLRSVLFPFVSQVDEILQVATGWTFEAK
jgi:hypothetical protein